MTKMKNHAIYEVSLKFHANGHGEAEILKSFLQSQDISLKEIVESLDEDSRGLAVYLKSRPRARELVRSLEKIHLKSMTVGFKRWRVKDWPNQWKKSIKPF